ncbi:MAG: SDR family oxidoreductase [Chloroflexi bacterium]|nr:SDR family oxidoreductase [Chloroflexota bacterium]
MELPPLAELVSLKGKRSLITGAAAGIGKAIAYRFAEAGSTLDLVDINLEGLQRTRAELPPDTKVNLHQLDLCQRESIEALWDTLSGKEPDILVNNAGIYPFQNFLEVDDAFLQRIMDINLNCVFRMCQQMIRRRKGRGGVIINIGSIEAILPFAPDMVPYSVSKAGVIALTRSLAKEYGKDGFRVNVLVPGGIATEGTRDAARDAAGAGLRTGRDLLRRLPMGRGGQPDEVARMALVLASDLATYVHGASIPVDGGFLSA